MGHPGVPVYVQVSLTGIGGGLVFGVGKSGLNMSANTPRLEVPDICRAKSTGMTYNSGGWILKCR